MTDSAELLALAAAAATAMVTAMATDAWETVKEAIAHIFRRAHPGGEAAIARLSGNEALVAGAPDIERARRAIRGSWELEFGALLRSEPGLAGEFQALIQRIEAAAKRPDSFVTMEQTNTARDGGMVFAAQHGNVHVHDLSGIRPSAGQGPAAETEPDEPDPAGTSDAAR